jgi:Protein of unknown function (DUF3108)
MPQANNRGSGDAPGAPASATSLLALLLTLAGGMPALADNAASLQPFTARFTVEWHGLNAGTSTIELIPNGNGRYTYASGNQARGIFRLAFPDVIRQSSVLQIDNGLVRPLIFRADDGSKDTSQDVALDFDWSKNRVTGTAEDRAVSLELKPGTQDAMSIQLQLMLELQAGHAPTLFWMADKNELKDYVYQPEGEATLATPLGKLPTVIWSSHRPNSDRITRVWYAPSLGFIPVQALRTRGSKLEWTMKIQKLDRPTTR